MSENLMDGLLSEMNRVREIIKEYEDPTLNGAGLMAAGMMKGDILRAEKSISSGNVIDMMLCYSTLKEYEF